MRFLIFICILYNLSAHAEPFTINIVETYQGHPEQTVLENNYIALYAPLGIVPRFVYYPSKRGLQLVNQGIIDAEAGRLDVTAKHYPNLLKVNEPVAVVHSGFYCLNKKNCQLSADLNVVVHSGFQSAQSFCKSKNLTCRFESNVTAIARMLEKNIAQSLLSSTFAADKILCAIQTDKLYFHNDPSLAGFSYHFVNKRHESLVPQLEASIRQLIQKGLVPAPSTDIIQIKSSCNKSIVQI